MSITDSRKERTGHKMLYNTSTFLIVIAEFLFGRIRMQSGPVPVFQPQQDLLRGQQRAL